MCVYITTPDCDVQERQRAMILFSFVGSDYLQTCLVVHKKTRVLFFISLFQVFLFCPPDSSLPSLPLNFFLKVRAHGQRVGVVGKRTKGPKKCVSKKRQVAIKYARANIEYK